MTLKQFMKKIGGMTDKDYIVELNIGLELVQKASLGAIKSTIEYSEYTYSNNKVNFFNIVGNKIIIQLG